MKIPNEPIKDSKMYERFSLYREPKLGEKK